MARPKISIMLRALLLLFAAAQQAHALIAGSFNIRYDNEGDVENGNGWSRRAPVIASLIRFHQFDVLGTQEALSNQVDDLQALLPAYCHYGVGRNDGKAAGEFATIFYRKDAFLRKNGGTFWLSQTPEKPSIGWDAKFNRICTWVELESIPGRQPLFVFNTHFDHQGSTARLESAGLILAKIQEIAGGKPALLTGDFNVDQTSESYRRIHDSGLLIDSFDDAAERYALNGTPNGFRDDTFSDRRIDHIFHTRGFSVLRYGILTDSYRTSTADTTETGTSAFPKEIKFRNQQPRLPSDHFPVLVELH